MELIFTKTFVKRYKKIDVQSQKVINTTLQKMSNDFSPPSLRVKKMKGYHNPDIWEAVANMDLRITFEIKKPNKIVLRNCGHHDSNFR